MNPMPMPGPGPAPEPAKKAKWPLFVGGGCLVLLVTCCVLPAGGYFGGNAVLRSTATETAERFIEAGHSRDGAAVHGMLTGYYASDATVEGTTAGLARCPGITGYTGYDLEVGDVDHPFDDFVSVTVTFHTPTGDVQGNIGVEDGEHISLYSEYAPGVVTYGDCDVNAWGPPRTPYY